jgi:hypothetical protein
MSGPFTVPTLTPLVLVETFQYVLKTDTNGHASYNRLLEALSDPSLCKINAAGYSAIVADFSNIETIFINKLNVDFSGANGTVSYTGLNTGLGNYTGTKVGVKLLATIADGFSLYDTKSLSTAGDASSNVYAFSPFTSASTANQITTLKDANGVTIPDSHMLRIAFQSCAGQLPYGCTFETKQSKGNSTGIEHRVCAKMIKNSWFNCGFISIALYNINM